MKKIIGLIFMFTGFMAIATCIILELYRTTPLFAIILGGFCICVIGFLFLIQNK